MQLSTKQVLNLVLIGLENGNIEACKKLLKDLIAQYKDDNSVEEFKGEEVKLGQ